MDPHADLHARIDRLWERASAWAPGAVADEINDLLSEGYARALMAEQRIVALDERVTELLMRPDTRDAGTLRSLTSERRSAARDVERLRSRLAAVHDRYLALTAR